MSSILLKTFSFNDASVNIIHAPVFEIIPNILQSNRFDVCRSTKFAIDRYLCYVNCYTRVFGYNYVHPHVLSPENILFHCALRSLHVSIFDAEILLDDDIVM